METNVFYGNKLRLARLLKGYTQQQLGEATTVSRQFIHQMESGIRQPAIDVLNAICEALDVKSNFFFTPILNDVKFEQCHFRKRKTTPVNLSNRVLAYGTIFESLADLINIYIDLPATNIPKVTPNDGQYTNSEVELAAEKCRKHWKLGIDTPIANVIRVLENAGVIITQFTEVSDKVDALSFNRKYPIIIRNAEKGSSCRIRFDLAHECGHLVLHEGVETGDRTTENEADRFASAFLFPRSAFIKEFPSFKGKNLNWNLIYNLKVRWGMSVRAIIYRAHSLNLITAQQYRSANVRLNRTGQTRIEKFDEKVLREEPELLVSALNILNSDIGIGYQQIADSLNVNLSILSLITGLKLDINSSKCSDVIPMHSVFRP